MAEGLELPAGALVLVGENGSGRSTLMEPVAVTPGLDAEGGSAGARHRTRVREPESLGLVVGRGPGASRWGYSLRDGSEEPVEVLTRRAGGAAPTCSTSRTPRCPSGGRRHWCRCCWTWSRPAEGADLEPTADRRQVLDDPRSFLRRLC